MMAISIEQIARYGEHTVIRPDLGSGGTVGVRLSENSPPLCLFHLPTKLWLSGA